MLSKNELLALLSLAYVGFAACASTWWLDFPVCILASEATRECATLFEGITRLSRFLWENSEKVLSFATVMIALFTLTLWRSTNRLWQATEQQFALARTEFLSSHRPKIRIKHVWLISEFWHDKPITVRVVCVNHGTTDAIVIQYGIAFFVVKEERNLPVDPKLPEIGLGSQSWPSGISFVLPEFSNTITNEQHTDIRNKRAQFYCLGYIHYADAVGRRRTTAFCRVLKMPDDPSISYLGVGPFVSVDHPDYEYAD